LGNKEKKVKKTKKKKRTSISFKLIGLFIILIAVPVIIIGTASHLESTGLLIDQFKEDTRTLGGEISDNINTYLDGLESSILFMSTDDNVKQVKTNPDSYIWMLKSFKNYLNSYPEVTNIYLGTPEKEMFVQPATQLPAGFDPTNTGWYKLAVDSDKLIWTQPYIDTATKKSVITAAVPVYNDNTFIGVLGIDVSLETISKKVTQINVGKSGYPVIYDSNATILVHKNPELVGKPSTVQDMVKAIINDEEFLEYTFNDDGTLVEKYAVINDLERLNWKIVSTINADEISHKTSAMLINSLTVGAIVIVFAIIIAYFASRSITKPIQQLSTNMEKIKSGDFSNKTVVKSKDEIGVLAESYNVMIDNLASLISSIQKVSYDVNEAAQNLAATSEQASASSDQVARTVEEIAMGASEQASDAEKGASLVSCLADKFTNLKDNADKMNNSAMDVIGISDTGLKVVEELKQKTELNNEGTSDVEKAIINLNDSIKYIGDILQTIDAIAEQTNLLALNASIEAARAGEFGKGFAVVADEIRKLAYDSRESSDQIKDIITNIQKESENTVNIMKEVKVRTTEQTSAVTEVNESFGSISKAIEKITGEIEGIAKYVAEMNNDKDEIVISIESISSVSEETAASSQEVTASMQQQSMAVEEVARAAEKLNELSAELNENINKFRI